MSCAQKLSIDLFVKTAFFIIVLYYIFKWIVRKTKYKLPPGPLGLPLVGCLPFLGEKPHEAIADMRKKYGDIIGLKLGPYYTVVLNEFNIANEVLSHPAALGRPRKIFDSLPIGFGAASGAEWNEQRKLCFHLMRNLGLGRGSWETLTKESTKDFIEELMSLKGKPADVKSKLQFILGNNIISLLLGRRLNPTTEEKEIKELIKYLDIFNYFGPSVLGSVIPGYRKFCEHFRLFGYDKAREMILTFCAFMKQEIEKHRSGNAHYKNEEDFINLYDEKMKKMQAQNIQHYFSDKALVGNLSLMYIGGTDTVISSLMWLFRLMAKHPEVQKKIHEELDEVIGVDGAITFENRHKVPYTFAVLQEVQRFATIVPLTTTRKVSYDFEVRGYSIPKGTRVTANAWAIHHDARNFPNPEKFQPERFLPSNKNSEANDTSKFVAFSLGKRNCPGETIAWTIIFPYFTTVMQKFAISAPPETELHFEVNRGLVEHLKMQPLCFLKRI